MILESLANRAPFTLTPGQRLLRKAGGRNDGAGIASTADGRTQWWNARVALVNAKRLIGAVERWAWDAHGERWWLNGHGHGRAAGIAWHSSTRHGR